MRVFYFYLLRGFSFKIPSKSQICVLYNILVWLYILKEKTKPTKRLIIDKKVINPLINPSIFNIKTLGIIIISKTMNTLAILILTLKSFNSDNNTSSIS